jgi:hypothetical protein
MDAMDAMDAPHDPAANAQRYRELCDRMLSSLPISESEFLEHFGIQDEGATSGPELGSTVPPISARDQHGAMRTIPDLAGPEGLLLVFVRSVYW